MAGLRTAPTGPSGGPGRTVGVAHVLVLVVVPAALGWRHAAASDQVRFWALISVMAVASLAAFTASGTRASAHPWTWWRTEGAAILVCAPLVPATVVYGWLVLHRPVVFWSALTYLVALLLTLNVLDALHRARARSHDAEPADAQVWAVPAVGAAPDLREHP